MTGRIVAGSNLHDHCWFDRRLSGPVARAAAIGHLAAHARNSGKRILFAVADSRDTEFICKTMRADRLGRVRITLGWAWPNGNRLIASSSVLGVRRRARKATRP